jgi:epoxyqueuosine reductase
MTQTLQLDVKGLARRFGFDVAAVAPLQISESDRDFFRDWCRDGMAADMAWLTRDPDRRSEPQKLLPEAASVLTLGVSYFQGPLPPRPQIPSGRVARYAWGLDYHDVIVKRLEEFRAALEKECGPGLKTRHALDSQPLLERAFARRAGLGFIGKNTNLIAPGVGSWIFLTELLVNVPLSADEPIAQGCGGCTECQSACPTNALDTAFKLDARKCIAYHTIENRGWIPVEFRGKMGDWIFGCDDCQDVCPFNARAKETQWPEFRAENGTGAWISLADILRIKTPEAFKARFRGTPVLRAKRAGLVRNACLAAASQRAEELLPLLTDCLSDAEPIVRGHAAWAVGKFPFEKTRRDLDAALSRESDPQVRMEIQNAVDHPLLLGEDGRRPGEGINSLSLTQPSPEGRGYPNQTTNPSQ